MTDYCDWIVHNETPAVYSAVVDLIALHQSDFAGVSFL